MKLHRLGDCRVGPVVQSNTEIRVRRRTQARHRAIEEMKPLVCDRRSIQVAASSRQPIGPTVVDSVATVLRYRAERMTLILRWLLKALLCTRGIEYIPKTALPHSDPGGLFEESWVHGRADTTGPEAAHAESSLDALPAVFTRDWTELAVAPRTLHWDRHSTKR